jgi:hypothetical protein
MTKAETAPVVSSESWDGLHFTCTPDQAMWLFLAMKDACKAVAERTHSSSMGTMTAYDQMLESADQWDFYNQLAGRAGGYAADKRATMAGLRFPDGRPYRAG